MDKSQQLAAHAVGQVLAGRNLTQTLESVWRNHPRLTPQQRAATQDLSYGALRHYGRLQALLDQLLQRTPDDPRVICLLLVALYQLEHGKASHYAVVDHAVKAAAQLKPWAKGLVNAVLRNFLRQREPLLEKIAADEVARYSYPQWWIDKLRQQYPALWQSILEAGNQRPPMTLRVNRRHGSAEDYLAQLAESGISGRPLGDAAIMLEQPLAVEKLPGFATGAVSVQDYGAQFAASLLDVQNDMHVLDACCAPGGKTGHILEAAEVAMTAMDSDAGRLARTRDNLERLRLSAALITGDAASPAGWWDGQPFDRILADVPCSASGIVRRHVDIKWLRREIDLQTFSLQQAAILQGLWPMLAIGGKLLYATCSVFLEENQCQIDTFLRQHADARQLPMPGMANGQLLPCDQHDGFFYALLQKI
ncbi:MAG TPA: 16S rRNA (cytosine(967)-C(5))-methyltransferase RsmB [Methylophilaceae bacterium]|nr:16S rRNA (cytosine(967)-C(5))-methyltransferase RsmB [Methylophilaceae bacterium]HQR60071.1 16S rRNA (cytosine(967)-C(5))-methyltransferase RsmB [Methylophilaceae bacterium]